MIRIAAVCLLTAALCAPSAAADDEKDTTQGNYHGAFTDKAWAKRTIRAELVAQGGPNYRAVLFVAEDGEAARVEITGKRDKETRVTALSGEVDLGPALGGTVTANGEIRDGVFTGSFGGRKGAFELKHVVLESPTLGAAPPDGAIVLFDGKNTEQWDRSPLGWCVQPDGSMQVCSSNLVTKQEFGDAQIHAEFMTPLMSHARGQARGNSGFYVMGRYEVQILDSFGELPKWDYCGGIYKVAVPLANASYPPETWQTYDVTIRAPRFDASGTKTANAVLTVVHNGVTIHDNLELPDITPGGVSGTEAPKGVLMLQDHHDAVRFRNIWIKPLD